MHYTSQYPSPLGELLLAADDAGLTGVWFVGQKYFARSLAPDSVAREIPLFAQVKQWLALYFAGQEPELEIPIHMVGTAFQKAVWRILRTIPYGQTMTYGAIARQVAEKLVSGGCPPRRWGAQWDTIQFPSLSHATGWWGPTAA